MDLSGFFLSDDVNNSMKWAIPSGTSIAANELLLFWADGTNTGMHANFKLKSAGEAIGLYNSLGNVVDAFSYPELFTVISYGRIPDGGESLHMQYSYSGESQ